MKLRRERRLGHARADERLGHELELARRERLLDDARDLVGALLTEHGRYVRDVEQRGLERLRVEPLSEEALRALRERRLGLGHARLERPDGCERLGSDLRRA